MPDTSPTQDLNITPSETPVSVENSVSPDTAESIPLADSTPPDMPSEALEAPASVVDTPLVNNDNPQPITPESQNPEVAIATSPSFLHNLLNKARETIQFRKRNKLEKIMELLNKKSKISNNDITELLRVSDATATRYLNTLEQEGKIKQSGRTGKFVFYTKI